MNSLFNQPDVTELLERIENLKPGQQRQWGKMNVAQMLAHCNVSMETAMGKSFMKPLFIGRLIGTLLKRRALSDKPFGKNSPTDKTYVFTGQDDLNFEGEKIKLQQSVSQFFKGGSSECTVHPHPFFGKLTSDEWGIFAWKHLDHHLRQFGV
jgi:hypothetical protein